MSTSDDAEEADDVNLEELRRLFLASMAEMGAKLHRHCSHLCGSWFDGAEFAAEILSAAFDDLSSLRDVSRLQEWLFRRARQGRPDFVRRMSERQGISGPNVEQDERRWSDFPIDETVVAILSTLQPQERAVLVLRDVLAFPPTETTEVVNTYIWVVKRALYRARATLQAQRSGALSAPIEASQLAVFRTYSDCFNRQDWSALGQLVRADAGAGIAYETNDGVDNFGVDSSGNYTAPPREWKLSATRLYGEPALLHSQRFDTEWQPYAALRLRSESGRVVRISEYIPVDFLRRGALTEPFIDPS
jgi:DNA-directed RNA polymerase specialized sigma24 family protein